MTLKEEVESLSFRVKFRLWMDYVTTQVSLRYNVEIKINTYRSPSEVSKIFPTLGIYTISIQPRKVKSFDEFCEGTDSGVSESLIGWYWRFGKESYLLHEGRIEEAIRIRDKLSL